MTAFLAALALAASLRAEWDMPIVDAFGAGVTMFLVCLDGQPTSACATVLESTGVASAPGVRTYAWNLPAVTPGAHRVVIQACTDGASHCSDGLVIPFVFAPPIPNPTNGRVVKIGGG